MIVTLYNDTHANVAEMSAASGGDGVSLVSVGSRVVRGPDWQWQDQVSNN